MYCESATWKFQVQYTGHIKSRFSAVEMYFRHLKMALSCSFSFGKWLYLLFYVQSVWMLKDSGQPNSQGRKNSEGSTFIYCYIYKTGMLSIDDIK